MKHVYSYQGTKVHLKMDETLADAYNRAIDAWFEAQKEFERRHGRKVTAQEIMDGKLQIRMTELEYSAWNAVGDFMNARYKDGLVLTEDDLKSDYLVLVR